MPELAPRSMLVTGASGFLGRAVLRLAALDDGIHQIIGVRKSASEAPPALKTEWRQHDLAQSVPVVQGAVNTVVHIAGEKRNPAAMYDANVVATQRLLAWAANAGVEHFIHVSSVGVYGAKKNSGRVDTTFPHTPDNRYERTKDEAETFVCTTANSLGLRWTIVQPSNVLGLHPSTYPLLSLMRAIQSRRFAYVGRGIAMANYVAVDDVAAAILRIVAMPAIADGHTYILNTPQELPDFVGVIAHALGRPNAMPTVPQWAGRTAVVLAEVVRRTTGRSVPFDRARFDELTNSTWYDGSHFIRHLGGHYTIGVAGVVESLAAVYRSAGLL